MNELENLVLNEYCGANAEALRKIKPIDYCQFIRFVYNEKDEKNVNKLPFTYHYTVDTEGIRRINDKFIKVPEGVKPLPIRDKIIKESSALRLMISAIETLSILKFFWKSPTKI